MSGGEDYDLHTHTEMNLEHAPGKCAGTCPLVRKHSEIKTSMHWSLLSGKKMAALVVAIDGTSVTGYSITGASLPSSSIKTTTSSTYIPVVPITRVTADSSVNDCYLFS